MKKKANKPSLDNSDQLSALDSESRASSRDINDLSSSKSNSDDEVDAAQFNRQNSQRFARQSSRRMSLAQSNRYSIISHHNNIEKLRRNQELLEDANLVNFENVAQKENLNFIDLARKIKTDTTEAITEAALKKEKRKLRMWDSIGGCLSLSFISLYTIEYEQFASKNDSEAFTSNAVTNTLRVVLMALCGALCVVQYFHYTYLLRIDKILRLKDKKDTLWTSGYFKYLVMECLLSSIVCPPQLDSGFDLDQLKGTSRLTYDGLCCIFSLARFYNVLKMPEQYSIWTTEKSTKICKQHRFKPDTSFMIKAELKRSPYIAIFASLFIVAILFGLAMHTIELTYTAGPTDSSTARPFESWIATIFFIFVTMTTVGYGDIYPKTHLGRFVVLGVGVIGTMLVSLMVVALSNSSELTNGEKRVFNNVDQLSLTKEVKVKASELIYKVFMMYRSTKIMNHLALEGNQSKLIDEEMMRRFSLLSACRFIVAEFKVLHYRLKTATSIPEDLILTLLETNEGKFKQIYANFNKVQYIKANCEQIRTQQTVILEAIDRLTAGQHHVAATLVCLNLKYQSNTV